MAGWKLRGYAVETLLGRGASSDVWRARVMATGEPVALKRLFVTGAEQLRRAHGEAALLTVLDHPNLVRLHDLVTTHEAAVLVLDLADGGSLAGLLAARGRLTPGEVITAIAPVAAALAYVHRQGVVHGDVTPANVLFTPGGVALLADLGVARLTGDDADVECTPAYIDPAVANGSVPAAASDVFMLGAVALHALTGAPPWQGTDAAAVLDSARAADPAGLPGLPARLAAAGVPDEVAQVVLRALSVEPFRRGTAADFALDLRHAGTPVAVELRAGRRADEQVEPVEPVEPVERSGGDVELPGDEPRQPFETTPRVPRVPQVTAYRARHAAPVSTDVHPAVPGRPAPTSAVHRPRPVVPRRPQRRFPSRRGALMAAAVVLAAGGLVGWRLLDRPATAAAHPAPAAASAVDWPAELRRLDARRAAAFAAGDPAALRQVYADPDLLDADSALLQRLVPPGCSLRGARTVYTAVRVAPSAQGALVTARAAIPATSLACRGVRAQPVAAVPASAVRIGLVRTAAGPRIASLDPG